MCGMKKITNAPSMGRNVSALRYGKLSTRRLSVEGRGVRVSVCQVRL
jgi:hypothetical protein